LKVEVACEDSKFLYHTIFITEEEEEEEEEEEHKSIIAGQNSMELAIDLVKASIHQLGIHSLFKSV